MSDPSLRDDDAAVSTVVRGADGAPSDLTLRVPVAVYTPEMNAVVIVPCYNEEQRIDGAGIKRLLAHPAVSVLLVDDGSRDNTLRVLDDIARDTDGRITVLPLSPNGGKAEAVRRGMLHAIALGADVVGYYDADLATPPEDMIGLVRELEEHRELEFVLGSRVLLLGRNIERHVWRHYIGRVFATIAATILGMPVYDTQCGAKALRVTSKLREAIDEPFHSRWAFDVELIGRMRIDSDVGAGLPLSAFVEVPLRAWKDVGGSKLSRREMVGVLDDLKNIALELRQRSRRLAPRSRA